MGRQPPGLVRGGAAPDHRTGALLVGDKDFVRVEHATKVKSVLPDARPAVVPRATHVGLFHEADIVLSILGRFLDD